MHNDDEPTRYMDCHGNMWNTREERDEFDRFFPPPDFETKLPLTPHDSMRAGAGTTTPIMTNQQRSMTNSETEPLLTNSGVSPPAGAVNIARTARQELRDFLSMCKDERYTLPFSVFQQNIHNLSNETSHDIRHQALISMPSCSYTQLPLCNNRVTPCNN